MFALRAVQSLLGPLSLSLQTEQAPAAGRATQLSCNAMLMDVAAMGVNAAFLLGGVCCGIALVLYGRFFRWKNNSAGPGWEGA